MLLTHKINSTIVHHQGLYVLFKFQKFICIHTYKEGYIILPESMLLAVCGRVMSVLILYIFCTLTFVQPKKIRQVLLKQKEKVKYVQREKITMIGKENWQNHFYSIIKAYG